MKDNLINILNDSKELVNYFIDGIIFILKIIYNVIKSFNLDYLFYRGKR